VIRPGPQKARKAGSPAFSFIGEAHPQELYFSETAARKSKIKNPKSKIRSAGLTSTFLLQ
jgi:hypothetical protein